MRDNGDENGDPPIRIDRDKLHSIERGGKNAMRRARGRMRAQSEPLDNVTVAPCFGKPHDLPKTLT
jgi:hypothetical protein